jgi:hypothetical protein
VPHRELRLPATGRPNQHYQRKFGDSDLQERCLRAAWSYVVRRSRTRRSDSAALALGESGR